MLYNDKIKFPKLYKGNTHVYCTLPLLVKDKKLRDNIHKQLSTLYPVRKTFSRGPLNLLRACSSFYRKMPVAEQLPNMLLDFDMNYAYTTRDIGIIADFLNNSGYKH